MSIERIRERNEAAIADLNPELQNIARAFAQRAEESGMPILITEGFRSNERQEELYAQGRTTEGNIVTRARAGESRHNHAEAFDFVPVSLETGEALWDNETEEGLNRWNALGGMVNELGGEWGGNWESFQDMPHVQLRRQTSQEGDTRVSVPEVANSNMAATLDEGDELPELFSAETPEEAVNYIYSPDFDVENDLRRAASSEVDRLTIENLPDFNTAIYGNFEDTFNRIDLRNREREALRMRREQEAAMRAANPDPIAEQRRALNRLMVTPMADTEALAEDIDSPNMAARNDLVYDATIDRESDFWRMNQRMSESTMSAIYHGVERMTLPVDPEWESQVEGVFNEQVSPNINQFTHSQIERLLSSRSRADFDRILSSYEIQGLDNQAMGRAGAAKTLAVGFTEPVSMGLSLIPGLAVAKVASLASKGARAARAAQVAARAGDDVALAASLRTAVAASAARSPIAASAAATAAEEVLFTGMLDALNDTQEMSVMDYAMSAGFGAAFGSITGAIGKFVNARNADYVDADVSAAIQAVETRTSQIAEDVIRNRQMYENEARATLGNDIDRETILNFVKQKENDSITNVFRVLLADVGPERNIFGNNETLQNYTTLSVGQKDRVNEQIKVEKRLVREVEKEIRKVENLIKSNENLLERLGDQRGQTRALNRAAQLEGDDAVRARDDQMPKPTNKPSLFEVAMNRVNTVKNGFPDLERRLTKNKVDAFAVNESLRGQFDEVDLQYVDMAATYVNSMRQASQKKGGKRNMADIQAWAKDNDIDLDDLKKLGDLAVLDLSTFRQRAGDGGQVVAEKIQSMISNLKTMEQAKQIERLEAQIREIEVRNATASVEMRNEFSRSEIKRIQKNLNSQKKKVKKMQEANRQANINLEARVAAGISDDVLVADNEKAAVVTDIINAANNWKRKTLSPDVERRLKNWMKATNVEKLPLVGGALSKVVNAARTHWDIAFNSESTVLQWFAGNVLDSPLGINQGGTAATTKRTLLRSMTGTFQRDTESLFRSYMVSQGKTDLRTVFSISDREVFYSHVRRASENKRIAQANKTPWVEPNIHVKQAVDMQDAYYGRFNTLMKEKQLEGHEALPDVTAGYMPYRVDPAKFLRLASNKEWSKQYIDLQTEAFMDGMGLTREQAAGMSRKWFEVQIKQIKAGVSVPATPMSGISNELKGILTEEIAKSKDAVDAAIVQRILEGKFNSKAKNLQTRMERDLTRSFRDSEGNEIALMDVMVNDPAQLMNSYTNSISGLLALDQYGLSSKRNFDLVMEAAIQQGATQTEIEMMKQVRSEFLGVPYQREGVTSTAPEWASNLMQLTRLARLGGVVFAQLAEVSALAWKFGAVRTLRYFPQALRLTRDVKKFIDDPTRKDSPLGEMDNFLGGVGSEYFKHTIGFNLLKYDRVELRENESALGRILSTMENAMGRATFFHAAIAVQQRASAELMLDDIAMMVIGKKTRRREVLMRNAGITDDMIERIRAEKVIEDLPDGTKAIRLQHLKDTTLLYDMVSAIERTISQSVQDTLIGEGSSIHHNWLLRLMTQFRSFSLLATTKQGGRLLVQEGPWGFMGAMMTGMMTAAAILTLRSYVATIGMSEEDREEYMNRALDPAQIAYAGFSYTAQLGIFAEGIDIAGGFAGADWSRTSFQSSSAVSRLVPSVGLVDQFVSGVATRNPEQVFKTMPFASAIPVRQLLNYMQPALEEARKELNGDEEESRIYR